MRIPKHIAIIMDGNGRWAEDKGWSRTKGHRYGVEAVQKTVKAAQTMGVNYLTLYTFSTENWKRPKAEIEILFSLMHTFSERYLKELNDEKVCIKVIGQREGLSKKTLDLVEKVEKTTQDNTRFYLALAINYGGRNEILRAFEKLFLDKQQDAVHFLSEEKFSQYLDAPDWPDPDLLIRTSGECRISNFLIWQCAYTEFVFMDVFWPDFNKDHLYQAIQDFSNRKRRFGTVNAL